MTQRDIDVQIVKENPDGSAVFSFDLTEQEQFALMRFGIITALKAGLEEAKKYSPDYVDNFDNNMGKQG